MFLLQRFPFDTTSSIGYTFALVIQAILTFYGAITLKCIALIGIVTLPILFSLINDLNSNLNIITAMCSKRRKRNLQASKKLPQFIQFHSDTIQFGSVCLQLNKIDSKNLYYLFQICSKSFKVIRNPIHNDLSVYYFWHMQFVTADKNGYGFVAFF